MKTARGCMKLQKPRTKKIAKAWPSSSTKISKTIESFQIHSDRIISCKIRLQGESLQIIQVYAPTKDYEDTDIETFYEDLDNAVNRKECKQHIIMGDFNAKIGIKEKNDNLKWIGPHGIGIRNDRGERLLDFAANNKLDSTCCKHILPKASLTLLDMGITRRSIPQPDRLHIGRREINNLQH